MIFILAGCNYGPGCPTPCGNCNAGSACDEMDGTCLNGCEEGFEGPLCLTGRRMKSPRLVVDGLGRHWMGVVG